MPTTNIHEAKPRLSKLVEMAERGEEVRGGHRRPGRTARGPSRPLPGGGGTAPGRLWLGRVRIAPEFDELAADITDAFGMSLD